jgi:hypothetical protein
MGIGKLRLIWETRALNLNDSVLIRFLIGSRLLYPTNIYPEPNEESPSRLAQKYILCLKSTQLDLMV